MRTLYFDCFSGAGGDMIVGALVDAGADAEQLISGLRGLRIAGFVPRVEKVRKQGFAATRFVVETEAGVDQPHRHLSHVRRILEESRLAERVRARAISAFERLADAEAEAHGITREAVHFHEVGAVDSIADVVGAMLGLEALAPERILASPLPVGSGTVTCAHGVMPVPAPATAILLKGVPLAASTETGELLTPTAAAVLTSVCTSFGPLPAMTIERIGMGAGTREGRNQPNVLRVLVGEEPSGAAPDAVVVLEAHVDDSPGEWVGHCLNRLLEEGARDAYCVPIYMKKQRPGVLLTVLCAAADVARLEAILFAETSTFGVRRHTVERTTLDRDHETVSTPYGPVRIKVGRQGGRIMQVGPEYEDCAAAARNAGVSLRMVMASALAAWHAQHGA